MHFSSFPDIFSISLIDWVLSSAWKRHKLILIHKTVKQTTVIQTCLLYTLDKCQERLYRKLSKRSKGYQRDNTDLGYQGVIFDVISCLVNRITRTIEGKGAEWHLEFILFGGMKSQFVFTIMIKCVRIPGDNHQSLIFGKFTVVWYGSWHRIIRGPVVRPPGVSTRTFTVEYHVRRNIQCKYTKGGDNYRVRVGNGHHCCSNTFFLKMCNYMPIRLYESLVFGCNYFT